MNFQTIVFASSNTKQAKPKKFLASYEFDLKLSSFKATVIFAYYLVN